MPRLGCECTRVETALISAGWRSFGIDPPAETPVTCTHSWLLVVSDLADFLAFNRALVNLQLHTFERRKRRAGCRLDPEPVLMWQAADTHTGYITPNQWRYASIHSAPVGGGSGSGRSRIEIGCRA